VDGGRNGPSCSCCYGHFEDVHRGGDGPSGCGGFEDAPVGDFEDVDEGGNGPNCCDGFADADGRWKWTKWLLLLHWYMTFRTRSGGSLRFTIPDPGSRCSI
ncbi:hypothetical protein MKW92_007171, partial [Papaver armeniacum]